MDFIHRNADGSTYGADPREISAADFAVIGHEKRPLLTVIRQFCLECSGGNRAEAAACTAIRCKLWPFRMGTDPFRAPGKANSGSFADRGKSPALRRETGA